MASTQSEPSRRSVELAHTKTSGEDHQHPHEVTQSNNIMATTTTTTTNTMRADATTPYQQIDSGEHASGLPTADPIAARKTLLNFILMSILFSANHGCVVGKYGRKKSPSCGIFCF
jgi:hypothetical protein